MGEGEPLGARCGGDVAKGGVAQTMGAGFEAFALGAGRAHLDVAAMEGHATLGAITFEKAPFLVGSGAQVMMNVDDFHIIAQLALKTQQEIEHRHGIGAAAHRCQHAVARGHLRLHELQEGGFIQRFHAWMSSSSWPRSRSVVLTVRAGVSSACMTVRAISSPWVMMSARPAVRAGSSRRFSRDMPLRMSLI